MKQSVTFAERDHRIWLNLSITFDGPEQQTVTIDACNGCPSIRYTAILDSDMHTILFYYANPASEEQACG